MNHMYRRVKQILLTGGAGLICALSLGDAAAATISGAIFTTTVSGTTVNGNIYEAKADVYLNGGPQNTNANGLPEGDYYFQVTDPSGAVLLSTDAITCRQLTVAGGKVSGGSGSCPHSNGSFNPANGSTPVQLIPYADTPNNGGEYKAWITRVADYNPGGCPSDSHGFCHSDTKTDNFKVRQARPAYVVACKFSDKNSNGVQDLGESVIVGWPMTAYGVDGAGASGMKVLTGIDGCVSFAVTPVAGVFPTVSVTEGMPSVNWVKTAPVDGSFPRVGSSPAYTVTGTTATSSDLKSGDEFDIVFGNHCPNSNGCTDPVAVTKDANPTYKVTWGINKNVDKTQIKSSGSGTFNYTVDVTHDGGTGFMVNGTIRVSNNNFADIAVTSLTDIVDNGGVCSIAMTLPFIVEAGEYQDVMYTCTYASLPAPGTNTATASWYNVFVPGSDSTFGTAAINFDSATIVDGTVNVTDTVAGSLGSVSHTDVSPKTFTYADAWTGTPGTCVDKPNTATFTSTTPNSTATGSASQSVKLCVGKAPTASKDATPAFKRTYTWDIKKSVDKTLIAQAGTSAAFNYTVLASETGFTDSAWTVSGTITVNNPNDWQAITVDVTDAINNGGVCTVTGGSSLVVPISGSATATYTCTYAAAPSASAFTNTATAAWDNAAFYTLGGSASGTAAGAFSTPTSKANDMITVTDVFNGGAPTTLGTLTATDSMPYATAKYEYARTLTSTPGTCTPSTANTATYTTNTTASTGSASQTVKLCVGADLTASKTATPAFKRSYAWAIKKSVDKTLIAQAGTSAAFNYTVLASETGYTDSAWTVTGTITVNNPNDWQAITVDVTDAISNGGVCVVTGGSSLVVPISGSATATYTCTYAAAPSTSAFTNTATAAWDKAAFYTVNGSASGTKAGAFTTPTSKANDMITVTDVFNGGAPTTLGTLTATDSMPYATAKYEYARTLTSTPGTCTPSTANTATYTTNTTASTGSASQTVKLCVGANLTASKTATPAFKRTYTWTLNKLVDKVLVQQVGGGTATFNYSVVANQSGVSDSDWMVTGTITVTNPNDWQAVTVNVADAINNGGACSVSPTSLNVPASGTATSTYTCAYGSAPTAAAFTNTATATWNAATFATPTGSASGTAGGAFTTPTTKVNATVTVSDVFNGGPMTTLGTLTATDAPAFASATYNYSQTVTVPANNCSPPYVNTATISQTSQIASQSVKVCGPAKTGALTKGFWQNKNGQGIITGGAAPAGVCDSGTWLRTYAPFQNLSATATCAQVASYAMAVIDAANSSGTAMNAMLKAQMLATSLDVYFSDPALGGNKISAAAPIGGINVDLTKICKDIGSCSIYENVSSVFGPANSLSVSAMLSFASLQSNADGSAWYGQVKATQELAKDAFDAINNQKVFAP